MNSVISGSPLFRLGRGVQSTVTPPISVAAVWATAYAHTDAKPLIDVSQGAPSSPPPPELLSALGAAAGDGSAAGYMPPAGDGSLTAALASEMRTLYGKDGQAADIQPADVAITAGCNMAYSAAIMTLCDAGDEVILPVPWYFNHQMTNNLLGLKTVSLPVLSKDGFQPSPERAASLVTERTRAIVLVSPNNPTGAVYSPSLIASFATLARKHNVALIIDETYRDFIVPGPPHDLFLSIPPSSSSSLYSAPTSSLSHHTPTDWDWRSTLIHLYSFSKAYHIPGHRLGALVASPSFQREAFKVLDCLQICANRSAQRAFSTPGLLHSLRPFVQQGTAALASRQKVFKASLPPPWKIGAQGAYYAFVRHPFTRRSAEEVCERLASEAGVVTLPVVYFAAGVDVAGMEVGWERWIRVSVANVEEELIREVCVRMGKVVDEWAWEVDVGA